MPAERAVTLPTVPFPLTWDLEPLGSRLEVDRGVLQITAGAASDLFVDPLDNSASLNAPRLLGEPTGDFLLSAAVDVAFAATFDAGVLLVWADERNWAKLCFEYSPDREPMVVSVVTRGISDDANAFGVDGSAVWLRVSRVGDAYAFHASTDGTRWRFVRHFALASSGGVVRVGFEAQSPTGSGCTASFSEICYRAARLGSLRDGS